MTRTTTTKTTTTRDARLRELLAAATELLNAKDNQMTTAAHWRNLRRAVRRARKTIDERPARPR